MSISFTKYIDITSAVEGSGAVRARELILRLYSTSSLIPTNSFAEFTSAADVASYFGSTSPEYLRAAYYFAFISKTATAPQKISFASWVESAVAPTILGAPNATDTLTQFNTISAGNLTLTIGAFTHTLTAINLSAAGSLAAVATDIQTAIRTQTDPSWATATVTYQSNPGNFVLTGGLVPSSGTLAVACTPATSPDVGIALGWENVNTILSYGSAAMTLTDTMIASMSASSNFGTFSYIPTLDQAQWVELATWNATENIDFMMLVPTSASNATPFSGALFDFPGVGMTLSPLSTEYPELLPGAILAATDYTQRNASQNYMFYQSALTPSVNDDADSDAYDLLRTNYYGSTQTAGQIINFYQRGVLMGLATSPADMNVYANEMWFKSAVGDALMSVLLALNEIPANMAGRSTLIATIQSVITVALFNGTISAGQTLTNTQIQTITSITGDPNAYFQLQTIGYWLNVFFTSSVTEDGRTEYQGNYTLVYTKNNAIRKVVGSHDLI